MANVPPSPASLRHGPGASPAELTELELATDEALGRVEPVVER